MYKDDKQIRLNLNENPHGPFPSAVRAVKSHVSISNRYDWSIIDRLITEIGKQEQVKSKNVLLGPGSTSIIDDLCQVFAKGGGEFITPTPSYSLWHAAALRSGLVKVEVPLNSQKSLCLENIFAKITPKTKFIYICNPNNPTGTSCDTVVLKKFIKKVTQCKNIFIVVDEAYIQFTKEKSLANLAKTNKKLIVLKTFSKFYGLAGTRVGYACCT